MEATLSGSRLILGWKREEEKERWGRGEEQEEEKSYKHHWCKDKTKACYTEGGGSKLRSTGSAGQL